MLRITVFVLGTMGLAWVSGPSLRSRSSHGFYRFFAWEAILVLLLLNFRGFGAWFHDPLAPRQIFSWVLLCASVGVLLLGVQALRARGRPDAAARPDQTLFGIEKTTELVSTGVYGYIRHPLYASVLYVAWGVFLKRPGWLAAGLAVAASAFLYATARAEEAEDVGYFGEAYRAYMARTARFVPFLL